MSLSEIHLEWQEPIVFIKQTSKQNTKAYYLSKGELLLQRMWSLAWISGPWIWELSFMIVILLMLFLPAQQVFMKPAIAVLLIRFAYRYFKHRGQGEVGRLNIHGVMPAHVTMTASRINLDYGDYQEVFAYGDLLKVRIERKRYGKARVLQMRLKTNSKKWYPVLLSRDLDISALKSILIEKGVPVFVNQIELEKIKQTKMDTVD